MECPQSIIIQNFRKKDTGFDIKSGRMPGDDYYGVEMLTR